MKYSDPSGYRYTYQDYQRERAENEAQSGAARFFNNYPGGWENYVSYTASSHYGALTYNYNWETGVYTDKFGRKVSFEEVQRKYLAPNVNESWDFEFFLLGEGKPNLLVSTKKTGADKYGRFKINIQIIGNDFSEYNWVQTVEYWTIEKGWDSPTIDPSDINNGFFYNKKIYDSEMKWFKAKASDGYFNDTPNAWQFKAELTLCGFRNGQWQDIGSFHWGYSLVGNSESHFERNINPSSIHQKWIKSALKYWNQ